MNVTAGVCVVRVDLESLTSALRVLLELIFTFVCITTKHQGCVYVADCISETPRRPAWVWNFDVFLRSRLNLISVKPIENTWYMEAANLVAWPLPITLHSTPSAVRTSNLVLNSSARSPHALRNDLGPLLSLGVPPHPSLDPVLSLSRLMLLSSPGSVTIHDAPLDGV